MKPLLALLDPAAKSGSRADGRRRSARSHRLARRRPRRRSCSPGELVSTHPNVRLEAVVALGAMKSIDGLADRSRICGPTSGPSCGPQRCAPLPPSTATPSLPCSRAWNPIGTGASAPRSPIRLVTFPAELATERVRVDAAGRRQARHPAVLTSLARLKAADLRTIARRSSRRPGLRRPRDRIAASWASSSPKAEPTRCARPTRRRRLTRHTRRARRRSRPWSRTAPRRRRRRSSRRSRTRTGQFASARRELSTKLDPAAARAAAIAPAPGQPIAPYDDRALIGPTTSPHVFIETAYGTIEFELAVLDAPQTSPQLHGAGAQGLSSTGSTSTASSPTSSCNTAIREAMAKAGRATRFATSSTSGPIVRGTVGMALEWRDTGGSQFFITLLTAAAPRRALHGLRPRRQRHGRRGPIKPGDVFSASVCGTVGLVERCELERQ